MAALSQPHQDWQCTAASGFDSIQAISFLLKKRSQKGWVRREIKLHILAAIAHWLDGSEERMSQLVKALRLASQVASSAPLPTKGPIIEGAPRSPLLDRNMAGQRRRKPSRGNSWWRSMS